LRCY